MSRAKPPRDSPAGASQDKTPPRMPAEPEMEESRRHALLSMLEDLEEDQLKIEQAAREWVATFDAILDPVFLHDADYRILRANRAYAKCAGMPVEQAIGKPYWQVYPKTSGPLASCLRVLQKAEEEEEEEEEEVNLATGETLRSRAFTVRDASGGYLYSVHVLEDVTEKHRIEAERHLLSEALRQAAAGLVVVNTDLSIRYANPAATALLGYEIGRLDGRPLMSIIPNDIHEQVPVLQALLDAGSLWTGEFLLVARDGARIPIHLALSPATDAKGKIITYLGSVLDLRPIRQAHEALTASETRFRLLTENAIDLIGVLAPDGRLRYISPSVGSLLGYTVEEVVGHNMSKFLHPDDMVIVQSTISRAVAEPGSVQGLSHRLRHKDGSWRYFESSGRSLLHEPAIGGIVINGRDVTERRQAERTIQRLAYCDPLTGLPNRAAVQEHLRQGLIDANAKGQTLALLLLDLNNFREVNDTLGHPNGDQVLIQVTARLKDILWESDMVARLAGDEFAVLLPRLADRSHIELVTRKIVEGFKAPFVVAEVPLDVQPSIGVALYPEHGTDADTLFQHADVALNAAKAQHQIQVIYDAAADRYNPQQLGLMAELRVAIAQDALMLYYQPKVRLQSGAVTGVEALVRWRHPQRGLLPPMEFIPIVEKTSLIDDLTRWVIKTALRQAKQWRNRGLSLKIAVNISARNLQDRDFVHQIMEIFSQMGAEPKELIFEITESAIMFDPEGAKRKLNELHDLGVNFSIADFGTGYSSLSYLKELPVSQLKIDQSFVSHMAEAGNAAIVKSTIDLAHNLDLRVVAEGVEDKATADQLRDMGCDVGQGYYFSRPVSPEELEAWWHKRRGVLAEE